MNTTQIKEIASIYTRENPIAFGDLLEAFDLHVELQGEDSFVLMYNETPTTENGDSDFGFETLLDTDTLVFFEYQEATGSLRLSDIEENDFTVLDTNVQVGQNENH